MDLHRLGIKVFCVEHASLGLPEIIPIFHRFIQNGSLEGLLIDVADYSHVYQGPGVLLVAHEGNYAFDGAGGRRGLVYYAKRRGAGSLADRLARACRRAFLACEKMTREAEIADRLSFSGSEIQMYANDRLVAPNMQETLETMRPVLEDLCAHLYPDRDWDIVREGIAHEGSEQERFTVTLRAEGPIGIDTLLERLGPA